MTTQRNIANSTTHNAGLSSPSPSEAHQQAGGRKPAECGLADIHRRLHVESLTAARACRVDGDRHARLMAQAARARLYFRCVRQLPLAAVFHCTAQVLPELVGRFPALAVGDVVAVRYMRHDNKGRAVYQFGRTPGDWLGVAVAGADLHHFTF